MAALTALELVPLLQIYAVPNLLIRHNNANIVVE